VIAAAGIDPRDVRADLDCRDGFEPDRWRFAACSDRVGRAGRAEEVRLQALVTCGFRLSRSHGGAA
jgi:hypothetical protein